MTSYWYLICHTGSEFATEGKGYKILDTLYDDGLCYEISDDYGQRHLFSEEPDEDGLSYATWFTLEEVLWEVPDSFE